MLSKKTKIIEVRSVKKLTGPVQEFQYSSNSPKRNNRENRKEIINKMIQENFLELEVPG